MTQIYFSPFPLIPIVLKSIIIIPFFLLYQKKTIILWVTNHFRKTNWNASCNFRL